VNQQQKKKFVRGSILRGLWKIARHKEKETKGRLSKRAKGEKGRMSSWLRRGDGKVSRLLLHGQGKETSFGVSTWGGWETANNSHITKKKGRERPAGKGRLCKLKKRDLPLFLTHQKRVIIVLYLKVTKMSHPDRSKREGGGRGRKSEDGGGRREGKPP